MGFDYLNEADFESDEHYEARMEARREEAEDLLERDGWRCADCGHLWDPIRHPATHTDPAFVERDNCPHCGGPPDEA